MNFTKSLGITAALLGVIVFIVACYLSFSSEKVALEPFLLSLAAILVGFLCIKKSGE